MVDIALPAEGVFHNLVSVSIKKTYPMQAYKSPCGRPPTSTTPAKCCSISRPTPIRSATTWWASARTHQRPGRRARPRDERNRQRQQNGF
ncbi:MAG: hypothetical protein WCS42_11205 [Verrucomicrobiota bacterium]